MAKIVADYLKKPYGRVVIPESDGTFSAEIIEFPGCIAVGDTAAEALTNLEDVARSWLEASLEKGQRISEPIENDDYSGKLVLRLPKSLHKKAAHMAARDGVSLNQFIVSSLAEQVGVRSSATFSAYVEFSSAWQSIGGPTGHTLASSSARQLVHNLLLAVPPSGFQIVNTAEIAHARS